MRGYSEIRSLAIARHGEAALAEALAQPPVKSVDELVAIPDDRWLAMASRCVFQAGFNWKVIGAKWPGFEQAFEGFDLGRWVMASDDDVAALLADSRIVRNGAKITSVLQNARFFAAKSRDHGGVGRWIGEWPASEFDALLGELVKNGSRLGTATAQYFLRFMGKDGFILSPDVTAALIREGVVAGPVKSASALRKVQGAFNAWAEESGQSLTAISRTLARSIDA